MHNEEIIASIIREGYTCSLQAKPVLPSQSEMSQAGLISCQVRKVS